LSRIPSRYSAQSTTPMAHPSHPRRSPGAACRSMLSPLGLVAAAVIQLGVLVVVIAAMLVVENLVLSPVATEG
ncbi:MAG: hypothetical protein ACRDQD_23060, partial [Nocardioidaceae bacterium]